MLCVPILLMFSTRSAHRPVRRNDKLHVVVLTGAGISAESGLRTFRDSGGLWEGYNVEDVATPEAWQRNPELVLQFYNERRLAMRNAEPNKAHLALVELESSYRVSVITQNVDDLHERAGSSSIIHLHGELRLARSTADGSVADIEGDVIHLGDRCPLGSQLRPHIVWFGEPVPLLEEAIAITERADILLIIGTSLAVYPAASLLYHAPRHCQKYLVDPSNHFVELPEGVTFIQARASEGVPQLVKQLIAEIPPHL